mmetsp:Transcript_35096/g.56377  ORF Transcript_35096/g.56377 Transcript_35096/m.56377 type:complete len:237 (-) Transcript_35096:38-748(-)
MILQSSHNGLHQLLFGDTHATQGALGAGSTSPHASSVQNLDAPIRTASGAKATVRRKRQGAARLSVRRRVQQPDFRSLPRLSWSRSVQVQCLLLGAQRGHWIAVDRLPLALRLVSKGELQALGVHIGQGILVHPAIWLQVQLGCEALHLCLKAVVLELSEQQLVEGDFVRRELAATLNNSHITIRGNTLHCCGLHRRSHGGRDGAKRNRRRGGFRHWRRHRHRSGAGLSCTAGSWN